jgi:arylsulfatase A-like enzyme
MKNQATKWHCFSRVVAALTAMSLFGGCASTSSSTTNQPVVVGAAQEQVRRPNVIMIVADDLAWSDVSTYGLTTVQTPNIDSIKAQGVAFKQGYVAAPVCAVSRAALLTGRYPQSFGFTYNLDEKYNKFNDGLPADQQTVAQMLKPLGYSTAAIGKWHVGPVVQEDSPPDKIAGNTNYPTNRGFDEFYGFLAGETYYAPPGTPGIKDTSTEKDKDQDNGPKVPKIVTGSGATPVDTHGEYLTSYFTDQAIEFINRSAGSGKPFFLHLAYNAPHLPLQVPQSYYDRFSNLKDPRRTFVAMISALDDGIGRVLSALDANGIREDTLIVFLSDNGCPVQYGICDCSHPFGSGKFTHLEGGIRVPFIMSWPRGMKERGKVDTDTLVSSLDVVPTILKAADPNGTQPKLDGIDLVSAVESKDSSRMLFFGQAPVFAVRQGRWKLSKYIPQDPEDFLWPPPSKAPSNGTEQTLLFDVNKDPWESTNVAAENEEIARRLEAALHSWRTRLPPPLWKGRGYGDTSQRCAPSTTGVY